jgi:hypothetical protein
MSNPMTCEIEQGYGWSSKREGDSNRLKGIGAYHLTVSPAEVDIWYKATVERATPGTEVRGRIVGPRCLFAETVEVASPLRSVRCKEDERASLIVRTGFANPGFWDPDTPLLYRVVAELWQDEQRCDACGFDLGFCKIEMNSGTILVNEKPFFLRGMTHLPDSIEEATARRQAGYNLVLAETGQWNWWVRANPMGFLLLEKVKLSTLTPHYIGLVSRQPCFLGFVLGKELLDRSSWENESFLRPLQERRVLIGLELDGPAPSLPNGLSFLICPETMLPAIGETALPKVVMRRSAAGREPARTSQGVLGWIHG